MKDFIQIIGHPYYFINKHGLIKRSGYVKKGVDGKVYRRRDMIRSPYVSSSTGYPTIEIQGKHYALHRLMAIHFIHNPDNKRCVNHIDGNKLNYRLENLEWVTDGENIKHAYDNKLRRGAFTGKTGRLHHRSRGVVRIDLSTNTNEEFESARQASIKMGRCKEYVSAFIRRGKPHNNIIWKYL